jgi:uncharacterized protein (TIGR03435 family)
MLLNYKSRVQLVMRIGTLLMACLPAFAQSARFEVASVRPSAPNARAVQCNGGPGTSAPGILNCQNYSLSFLVMKAYDLRSFQLTAPGWMDTARYDVSATLPPNTGEEEFAAMQQNLLSERFGFRVHFENKEVGVYRLSVSKDGPKLARSEAPAAPPDSLWRPPVGGPPARTKAHITRKGDTIAELARFLGDQLGRPVLDATGLQDRYDYELDFMMEPGGRATDALVSAEIEPGSTLLNAVKEQLGLTLTPGKGQIRVLVVDKAERMPTEN